MELLVYIFCCYLNYSRAKLAHLSGAKWALFTFIAILITAVIGFTTVIVVLFSKDPNVQAMINEMSKTGDDSELQQYILKNVNFLNQLFVFFCGLGGYLFIRYILNKKVERVNPNLPFDE